MADLNHKEVLQLLEDDWRSDRTNRDDAVEDLRFVAGDQWTQQEREEREADGRLCLTINRMPQFVNQVTGDIRQAQPATEVFPVDGQEDVPVANIFEGLIRQIEYQSKAHSAYAHGADSTVRAGIGHWRFETDTVDDSVFEQEIKIKRILDPLAVVWDSGSVEIDRADAKHAYITDFIHDNEFKRTYKNLDRTPVDTPLDGENYDTGLYWRRDDFTRIAEYWYEEMHPRKLVMLATGQTLDITDWNDTDLQALRASGLIQRERTAQVPKIKRQMLDGLGFLSPPEDWAGKFIPIVPCMGVEVAFDGKIVRHGLVRFAKDAQKLYNFWRSQAGDTIARSPKAPWLVTPNNIKGYEGYWNNANNSNLPYLPFNIDSKAGNYVPVRQQPAQVPAAMWQEGQIAIDDMKGTTGIHDASLGAQGNEQSGKAIIARQREGDVGSFIYTDNFVMAMQRSGQILVDLIPRIYDTQRQIRILGADGQENFVAINTTMMSADGEPMLINDLSQGRFDVRVKVGASYTTARVDAREQISTAMQGNPKLWGIIGDLFFENSDFPGATEIAERIRNTIDPKILGEDQDAQPNPLDEIQTRLAIEKGMAEVEGAQADVDKTEAETDRIVAETVLAVSGQEAIG